MPMNPKQLIIKCYAKRQEGAWVAVCIDFCLATQGESFEEAKRKLEEQIYFYVDEALQDKEYGSQLLCRRAPISSWVEYYFILLSNMINHHASVIFDEMMPLRPA
jgi:predicted RNase H-like HicB family nuclease